MFSRSACHDRRECRTRDDGRARLSARSHRDASQPRMRLRRRSAMGAARVSRTGASAMEQRRFDALTRAFADGSSRRRFLRRAGLAGMSAALNGLIATVRPVAAGHCNSLGCGCITGTRHQCGRGLVCCPSNPGLPGGAGVCAPAGQCGGSCVDQGQGCPAYCNWGDYCPDCCSGYCGSYGVCDQQSCTGVGCACATGTYSPCDVGLQCCALYPGLPGGAGVCQYGC